MNDPRTPVYLHRMRSAAIDARSFVADMDERAFLSDRRTQQAVVMSLMIIGEAATRMIERHPDFVARSPDVPWTAMRGLRNRIAHGYFEIDMGIVWSTVQTALPALLEKLGPLA